MWLDVYYGVRCGSAVDVTTLYHRLQRPRYRRYSHQYISSTIHVQSRMRFITTTDGFSSYKRLHAIHNDKLKYMKLIEKMSGTRPVIIRNYFFKKKTKKERSIISCVQQKKQLCNCVKFFNIIDLYTWFIHIYKSNEKLRAKLIILKNFTVA